MSIFSYHLIELPIFEAVRRIFSSPISKNTKGLIHSEYMTPMTLGSPIFSPSRVLIGQVAVFMQWENENALENNLEQDSFGRILAKGWHVRLSFIREWGKFSGFKIPTDKDQIESSNSPVVAVTIARMKPLAVPRFIHWGRPVEKLVRDHPGTILSLASVKFPNTVSTFSIWKSEKEMTDMVHGHSKVENRKGIQTQCKKGKEKTFILSLPHYDLSL